MHAPMPTRRDTLALLAGAVLLPGVARAGDAAPQAARHFLFGSPVELLVRPPQGRDVGAALAAAMAGLARIHRRWNAWKPGELSELNRALRERRATSVSPALAAVLREAARLEHRSHGLFNPGIGGAIAAWGFHDDVLRPGSRPLARALAAWREAAPSLAQLDLRGERVASFNPRLQLDLGGYGKGVAVDRALDQLSAAGVGEALVDLGGNLAAMSGAGEPGWHIGIREPGGQGLVGSLVTQGREAVVTSGSYERFRVLDGERCAHVLDPHTLAPVTELVSVTVVHPSAGRADAAATALLVAGPRRWRRVAERMGVHCALVIDRHERVELTPSMAGRLRWSSLNWQRRAVAA
ncbi:FAD:protein FMN transferase [Piscinibacter sp.]|uniref:FAD:protein FMN transferase n=1 Tax=Piscinibacter sp. TaxID=1903157 RepID=UPI003D0D1453